MGRVARSHTVHDHAAAMTMVPDVLFHPPRGVISWDSLTSCHHQHRQASSHRKSEEAPRRSFTECVWLPAQGSRKVRPETSHSTVAMSCPIGRGCTERGGQRNRVDLHPVVQCPIMVRTTFSPAHCSSIARMYSKQTARHETFLLNLRTSFEHW